MRPSTLLKKRLWYIFFPVNFAKFLETSILHNTSGRLLLSISIFVWVHHLQRILWLQYMYYTWTDRLSETCCILNQVKWKYIQTFICLNFLPDKKCGVMYAFKVSSPSCGQIASNTQNWGLWSFQWTLALTHFDYLQFSFI